MCTAGFPVCCARWVWMGRTGPRRSRPVQHSSLPAYRVSSTNATDLSIASRPAGGTRWHACLCVLSCATETERARARWPASLVDPCERCSARLHHHARVTYRRRLAGWLASRQAGRPAGRHILANMWPGLLAATSSCQHPARARGLVAESERLPVSAWTERTCTYVR